MHEVAITFHQNCWYVAAWDHELPRQGTGLLKRTILSESRTDVSHSDGKVVA